MLSQLDSSEDDVPCHFRRHSPSSCALHVEALSNWLGWCRCRCCHLSAYAGRGVGLGSSSLTTGDFQCSHHWLLAASSHSIVAQSNRGESLCEGLPLASHSGSFEAARTVQDDTGSQ